MSINVKCISSFNIRFVTQKWGPKLHKQPVSARTTSHFVDWFSSNGVEFYKLNEENEQDSTVLPSSHFFYNGVSVFER